VYAAKWQSLLRRRETYALIGAARRNSLEAKASACLMLVSCTGCRQSRLYPDKALAIGQNG